MLLGGLLELLAPTRCAGCDLPGVLLCERCRRAIVRVATAAACPRCGAPDGARHCSECDGRTYAFAGARCAGVLTHPLARLVVLYKDGGERRLAPVLATLLVEALADWTAWPDAVAGIPASRSAMLRRGFDHGAVLADSLASELSVARLAALVSAAKGDQRRLGREQRAANVARGLVSRPGIVVPSRVLLVDDVLTTGATLDAAARVLLAAGAAEVRVAAVARACEW